MNGVPVTEQSLEDLWASLGVVPQSAFLFSGTIASNLRLGRESASEEDLWWALDVAQAREFVAATPGGLDAPVDQGGTNLSGGQRQRLSIARALVTRAPLLIFDDCFSALDARTDALLRQALREEIADTTTLIVAQRVSTIMDADQIIVLDEGRVVGIGRHEDLVTTCPTYRDIAVSQLGEAALS